eukprot:8932705-Ditylum_brightwellii.AAC.1
MACDVLNNDESTKHPEDFSSALPFLDDMGTVNDESSDDQMIHPKHAKVAVKICHTIKKLPLKLDDKVHTSAMINLGVKETTTAGVSILQLE